jgi:hypothetical protein
MPRTENNNNNNIIKIKEIFLEATHMHLTCPTYPTSPHHTNFALELSHSPVALPLSFIFCFFQQHIHTHTLSPTLSFGHSHSLSLSPVNHLNHRRNSGRIYRRKPIGDFLGSIYFQYFKVKALCLSFFYILLVSLQI